MEEEKEERAIYTTMMFDNLTVFEKQEIDFVKDEWDHEQEFSNLWSIVSWGSLLFPLMSGLTVIKDQVHTLKQYAVLNH